MHKVLYHGQSGQLILNEVNLSVPTKGLLGARGFEILTKTSESYVVPMFKMAGELHYLFTMNAIHSSHSHKRFVGIQELAQVESMESLLASGNVLGADHIFDIDPLLSDFEGRNYIGICEEKLREVVAKILIAGSKPFDYDSVLVFTNSGVGPSTTLESESDGVIRDAQGLGTGMRLHGEFVPAYDRGIKGTYQNTGKPHIHLIPMPYDIKDELFQYFIDELRKIHEVREEAPLQGYRNKVRRIGNPDIGVISVAHIQNVDEQIWFEHFSDWSLDDTAREELTMSSLAGSILREKYGALRGIDFSDQQVVKALRQESNSFYKDNILT